MSEVEASEQQVSGGEPGGVNVTLPSFEGPLDLLLHLIQKHELEILDIPIAFITEKYLEYLAVMTLIDLDVASEYLVMAATLAYIKSKSLLPPDPAGAEDDELSEDEEDPRENLIRRLLEYQKYKKAGEDLTSRGIAGRDIFLRGMPIEQAIDTGLPPLAQVPLFSLVEAFQSVLSKSKVKLSHDIVHERVNLVDRINELVDILRAKRRVTFEELFEGQVSRFDLVITFLALLEMTRLRMTKLTQASFDAPIYVEFTVQVGSEEETIGGGETATATAGAATTDGAEIREALDRNGFVTAEERGVAGLAEELAETRQEATLGEAEAEAEDEELDDELDDDETFDMSGEPANEDATLVDELDEAALAAAWEEEMAPEKPAEDEVAVGKDVDAALGELAVPDADDLDFDAPSGSDPDEETDES